MTCPHCNYEPTESQKGKKVYCCPASLGGSNEPQPPEPRPLLIRGIERQRIASDTGVGDTVERLLSRMGGDKFKWVMNRLGVNCGCEDRKQWLNRVYPY